MKKTIEEIGEEVWDKYSEYIGDDIHSLDSVAGSSIITSRYRFLKAAQEISKPLVDRIAELEEYKDQHVKPLQEGLKQCQSDRDELQKKNDMLLEALEITINFCQQWAQTPEEIKMLTKAKEALKTAKQ